MSATKTSAVLVDVYMRSSVTLKVPVGTSPAEVRRLAMDQFRSMAETYVTKIGGELVDTVTGCTMEVEEENWRNDERCRRSRPAARCPRPAKRADTPSKGTRG